MALKDLQALDPFTYTLELLDVITLLIVIVVMYRHVVVLRGAIKLWLRSIWIYSISVIILSLDLKLAVSLSRAPFPVSSSSF